MNFLLGGGGTSELMGILVGHLYYFVMMKYPAEQGTTLLQTPEILYRYLPNQQARTYMAPERPTARPSQGSNPTTTTGYNWGQGRRLEDWR